MLPILTIFGFTLQENAESVKSQKLGTGFEVQASEDPTCKDCHADLVGKKVVHSPANDDCRSCHLVNIPEHPGKVSTGLFLKENVPALCYSCHAEMKMDIDTSRTIHQALSESKQCNNCHSPHSSDEKKLLNENKKELCLTCHNKEMEINGKKTKNISLLIKTSKVIHPALKGGCTSCHKPHASSENYLLIGAFPVDLYVPGNKENYAVCWECHDSDLLELSATTTATNFRNGDRNLHNVHLRGARGRSCVMCHDMHASNNNYLILDKIPFGKWSFELNFAPVDSGGSCSPGCHGFTEYKR
ncbi:MAG: cytochrome c3 family protein [Bacteroidetes bacterium]|nr:cytochrome c3 family protein [Bacteroidota bacterium]